VLLPRSRSTFATKLRGNSHCVSRTNTIVECTRKRERALTNRSKDSEVELVLGIQKKKEFWVSEGEELEGREKV